MSLAEYQIINLLLTSLWSFSQTQSILASALACICSSVVREESKGTWLILVLRGYVFMCFVNLYLMFLAIHSSLATAFQKCFLSPSRQTYVWTVLSREAVVQLGNNFFPL